MKKLTVFTALLLSLCFAAAGCGGNKAAKVDRSNMPAPLAGAPEWVLSPESAGKLCAVGSARQGSGGMQFQRTEALASGRDELARIISVDVKNLFKNFQEATGVGDAETFDRVATNVSKQVTSQVLSGSRQKEIWMAPDNVLYVLVTLDSTGVKEAVKEAARTSLGNEQSLHQKLEAKKAHEELDREIEKTFGN